MLLLAMPYSYVYCIIYSCSHSNHILFTNLRIISYTFNSSYSAVLLALYRHAMNCHMLIRGASAVSAGQTPVVSQPMLHARAIAIAPTSQAPFPH